ncbi:hypothetical protein L208DRAFT_1476624 [Tricholoma matsutake]|nr:hypothetical protein L208DRAFT_1476624 [Tricholoma matsutake 945]
MWIDLCQKAWTDPHDLMNKHLDNLFMLILGASSVDPKVHSLELMCGRYLAFVSPATVLPQIIDQL